MKRVLLILSAILLAAGTVSAQSEQTVAGNVPLTPGAVSIEEQATSPGSSTKKVRTFPRFQIGLRGGVNAVNHKFARVNIDDAHISPGPVKAGFSAGLIMRLNISRLLHIQSEFNFDFVNYAIRVSDQGVRDISIRTERFEIPLELGLQFGPVRLFGGPMFRAAQAQRIGAPYLLRVGFNNSVGLMGGVGLNIRKFFLDFRISGYPGSSNRDKITYDGISKRVKVSSSITYGGSIGFYF